MLAWAGCGQEAGEAVEGVGQQIDLGAQTAVNAQLALLRQQIAALQMGQGRFPATLDELADVMNIAPMPVPPSGLHWKYSPDTGELTAETD